jgi:hypothetical protein
MIATSTQGLKKGSCKTGTPRSIEELGSSFQVAEMWERQHGTDFSEVEMTQTAFETWEVVNIQMVWERKLLYNGNRAGAPEQAAEAFCAIERR